MKKALLAASLVISVAVLVTAFTRDFKNIKELLIGYEEVPAVSTVAGAEFHARISDDETSLEYELSYAELEGAVTQAHIHFGQRGVNGGISVWLCGNATPPGVTPAIVPPPGTPACPPSPATVTGTLTAANVVGPAGQGIAAGEFAELVRAIRAGKTYANVHSTKFPGGEVRSQIEPGADGHGGHK